MYRHLYSYIIILVQLLGIQQIAFAQQQRDVEVGCFKNRCTSSDANTEVCIRDLFFNGYSKGSEEIVKITLDEKIGMYFKFYNSQCVPLEKLLIPASDIVSFENKGEFSIRRSFSASGDGASGSVVLLSRFTVQPDDSLLLRYTVTTRINHLFRGVKETVVTHSARFQGCNKIDE
jgi:hypothetical protein